MITQNIIGFELSAESSRKIFAFNPSAMTDLPEGFSPATQNEVDRALQKAKEAWRVLRKMDPAQRALFLNTIADGIEDLGDILVRRMMNETAYPESRVLTERRRTIFQLRMYAEFITKGNWREIAIDEAQPDRKPSPRPDLRRTYIAIGPVIVFSASNFPLAYSTIGGDSTSALAAGCPVIIKAHESHLGTNALVAEVLMNAALKTGMPDGTFSSLNGDGLETGKQLVLHPLTAAVGFTGSLNGGRALFDLGSQREIPIPVFAEMGSVNPIFLFPGSVNSDHQFAETLAESMTLTVGQFCTNPGIIILMDDSSSHSLIDHLKEILLRKTMAPMLNENIANNFHNGVARLQARSDVSFIVERNTGNKQAAAPLLATVHARDFIKHHSLHQEVFGPFSLIVLCRSMDEMFEAAKSLDGQLTASIHSTNEERELAKLLIEIILEKAGRLIFNGVPTGVEVCEAMTHGGPYPASTDSRFTAVGHHSIRRWLRPVTFQNCPEELLPPELKPSAQIK